MNNAADWADAEMERNLPPLSACEACGTFKCERGSFLCEFCAERDNVDMEDAS